MFRIGIVGSGPAAFYTAQKLLKSSTKIKIDMFEKLPVPFGLIRYGVAPDHPDVKNVIRTFTQVAKHEHFRFFGNVNIGTDISVRELRQIYHGVVLAYGASQDRKLNIPGENLRQVYSAMDLVGWYNGLPEKETFKPDLRGEDAIIIGHGNVALDIARILLSPIDLLKKTDIPDVVLDQLAQSKIKRLRLVGRRGPFQVAFTIKEFRELVHLQNVRGEIIISDDMNLNFQTINELPRPKKRLLGLMSEIVEKNKSLKNSSEPDTDRYWSLHFLRSPEAIYDQKSNPGNVDFVRFKINELRGDTIYDTHNTVDMNCQMVVRSIGYQSLKIDPDIPFDNRRNIIPNINGKIVEDNDGHNPQSILYCVGWIKRGPVGVILNTLADAVETSTTILSDIDNISQPFVPDNDISDILKLRGTKYLSFSNWEELDKIEMSLGEKKGKPREKLTNIHDMMMAATKTNNLK